MSDEGWRVIDDEWIDVEEQLLSAYRRFVEIHGYAPGLRFDGEAVYFLPRENDGVVESEPGDA